LVLGVISSAEVVMVLIKGGLPALLVSLLSCNLHGDFNGVLFCVLLNSSTPYLSWFVTLLAFLSFQILHEIEFLAISFMGFP
jgi:hypothetical protein